jgi:hypothetical protein
MKKLLVVILLAIVIGLASSQSFSGTIEPDAVI